jgi:hypothetical protein
VLSGLDPIAVISPEIFEDDEASAAFGIGEDGFAQAMVRVALKSRLTTGNAPERTLSRSSADFLQCAPPLVVAALNPIDTGSGMELAGTVDRARMPSGGGSTEPYSDGLRQWSIRTSRHRSRVPAVAGEVEAQAAHKGSTILPGRAIAARKISRRHPSPWSPKTTSLRSSPR